MVRIPIIGDRRSSSVQLGDVGGDAPGFVVGEQMSRRATARAGEAMAMR
jgi:hypothetical protein